MTMTSLERVSMALSHREPDRVPVYPILSGVSRNLIGASYKDWALKAEVTAEALIKAQEAFELDCICTLTDLSVEAADFGQKIVYPEMEAAHPDFDNHFIKTVDDFKLIRKVDPRLAPRMSEHIKLCRTLVERKGQEVPIVAFVFGPLGVLAMMRGIQNTMMDLIMYPAEVKEAVNTINEVLLDYCDALIDTGVHAIMLDTLFASKSIMSKTMWQEFEGEYCRRLAKHIHDRNCMVMIHNCGKGIYFDVQIEAMEPEAISFNHLPDDCSSPQELKSKYGHITTLIGMVEPTQAPFMAKARLEKICREQIDLFKKDGGFILATGCEYPCNAPLDGARTIVEAAKKYGQYHRKATSIA